MTLTSKDTAHAEHCCLHHLLSDSTGALIKSSVFVLCPCSVSSLPLKDLMLILEFLMSATDALSQVKRGDN